MNGNCFILFLVFSANGVVVFFLVFVSFISISVSSSKGSCSKSTIVSGSKFLAFGLGTFFNSVVNGTVCFDGLPGFLIGFVLVLILFLIASYTSYSSLLSL